ncbi:MAG: glycosyl hydrolase [Lishizhenia sp.]
MKGILVVPFLLSAQAFKNVQLPKPPLATYPFSQVEPSIAIHPTKKRKMVAGAVMNDFYYSTNGGKKWKSKSLTSAASGVGGDPVLHIDKDGTVYYFHLSNPPGGQSLDRIVCQTTDKVTGNFNDGSYPVPNPPKVQDKQWVAEHPSKNEMYMTWTEFDAYNSDKVTDSSHIVFSKSTDSGQSWSKPKRISIRGGDCLDGDNTVEGAVPTVDNKGNIYVIWTGPNGLVMNKSLDGGETWGKKEIEIAKQPEGWAIDVPGIYRCNGLPILSCSRKTNTLFLNWTDQRNGLDDTDVFMSKSTDGGLSWTHPKRVNQDTTITHQFFTWMTVDQSSGHLYFVYFDRRKYADNQTDVVLAVSRDEGETFEEFTISNSPFVPNKDIFFGDYNNIAAVKGSIRPIWPRMDNGKITLWTAIIDEKTLKRFAN